MSSRQIGVAVLLVLVLGAAAVSALALPPQRPDVAHAGSWPAPGPQAQSSSRTMVIDVGPAGSADSVYARSPFVLRDADGSYKMWYSGYDGSRNRGMYATSPDGVHWTKHGVIMDVLTPPYNWDSVGSMHVIKVGATYQGWFHAGYWSGGPFGFWGQIYHATSTDGATWNVTGVVLPPNQAWDIGMTNNPYVVRDSTGRYWMSFSGWNGTTTRLGIATSMNGTWFVPYAGNPILPLGPTGAWDSVNFAGSSLVLDGSSWTLWYDGSDGSVNRIGLAHSADGFNWTKDATNPVLTAEPSPAWDDQSVMGPDVLWSPNGPVVYYVGSDGTNLRIGLDTLAPPPGRTMVLDVGPAGSADGRDVFLPSVLRDTNGSYKMWYTGNSGNHDSILLATSPDGLAWTKVGVVMDISNGAGAPFVLKIGSTYHMWFTDITWCCSAIGYLDQIYHATSTDGIHWTAPVFAVGAGPAGSWNNDTVSDPWIVRDAAGVYRMFYLGSNDTAVAQIGVATSTDLVTWTPYSGNPVFHFGAPGSWDGQSVASPSVVRNGTSWVMYYGGLSNGTQPEIGRAFSSDGYHWTRDATNPVIRPEPSPAWDDVSIGSPDLAMLPSGPAIYYAASDGTHNRIGILSFTLPTNRQLVLSPGPAGSPDADALYSGSGLHDTDGSYKMYYTGLANGWYTTLLATSSDGVHFAKQGAVLPTNTSNAVPFVMKVGSLYHMWYEVVVTGCGPFGYCDEIYSATSADGRTWNQQGLVLGLGPTGAFDAASVSDPHVVAAGDGTYRMYYTGTDSSHDAEIGMATSTNLLNWTRYAGNPVLPFGAPGAWDNAHVAAPSVALAGFVWTMYYYGFANGSSASIGRATSPDGLHWIKDAGNPVIMPDPGSSWDDTSVAFPDFSADGYGAHLYYRGSNATTSSIGVLARQAASSLAVFGAASPTFAQVGQTVSFTCSAWGGTPPYTSAWSFGDGATIYAPNITHAYATAGNFTATCTVTDAASAVATATTTITVVPASSSAPLLLVDYVSPRGYICPVPDGWSRTYNLTSGSYTYDLFLQGTVDGLPANMLLDTQNASGVQETPSYLNSMLNTVVHGVQQSLPDAYLESSRVLTVSNHLGVEFEIGYSSHPIVQFGLIVVSAANSRAWNVVLTGPSSAAGTLNATFALVVQGFQITLSSSPSPTPGLLPGVTAAALYLGGAVVVIIAVLVLVAYLASRPRPSPRPAAPVAPAAPAAAAAVAACPYCGSALMPYARFCGNCGTPVLGGPPPPPGGF